MSADELDAARSALPPAALAPLPEAELAEGALAVADLHLDAARRESVEPFVRFLRGRAAGAPALVVLGDLFDVWVGPSEARLPGAAAVLLELRALTERGARVHVVPGNRDFLFDAAFERASGATLHAEGFVARVGGARVLCLHGDVLCTRDAGYLRLRRALRRPSVRWLGTHLPHAVSSSIARRLRRASVRAIAAKLPEEKTVQRAAAELVARAHRADTVLCGHAHAFRDERLDCGARWVVLDAFGAGRDVAALGARGALAFESSPGCPKG